MPQNDLLNAAEEIATLIADARESLAQGLAVDLSLIEKRVAAIYGEVSASAFAAQDRRAALLARLNALMPQLNALEADLTATQETIGAQG